MSEDKNTTVFYNYYNASTPTLTGITSQLCSILPPTGQKGVTAGGAIRYNTPCLPEILKEQGYKYSNYITAVEKNYSGKGEVIADMGTDEIYGTEELRRIIKNEPLSWGYSDHQMMPVMINMAKTKAQPFLIMLSSVDTHPPFNQAKDGVIYDDGKSNLLNSVHTTDDAFAKFWQEFKASPLADNTIVITVADHAIFPASYASEAEKKLLAGNQGQITFYDQNLFMIYLPDTTLPKKIDTYAMGIDFTPTLLQILNVNIPNYFEGMSILDNRKNYPNLLGMNEYELYINAQGADGKRDLQYGPPGSIKDLGKQEERLTLYEYLQYYNFKKEKLK